MPLELNLESDLPSVLGTVKSHENEPSIKEFLEMYFISDYISSIESSDVCSKNFFRLLDQKIRTN